MRVFYFRTWTDGDGRFVPVTQRELYSTELDAPTREWYDRANDAGFSMRGFLRLWNMGSERIHAMAMRATPLLRLMGAS